MQAYVGTTCLLITIIVLMCNTKTFHFTTSATLIEQPFHACISHPGIVQHKAAVADDTRGQVFCWYGTGSINRLCIPLESVDWEMPPGTDSSENRHLHSFATCISRAITSVADTEMHVLWCGEKGNGKKIARVFLASLGEIPCKQRTSKGRDAVFCPSALLTSQLLRFHSSFI